MISVIIPAYNHEEYIEYSIESVLEQSFQKFELIIVNDGSTDNTEQVIKKYKDPRIIYIKQNNHGAHYAINRGINASKGKYISILNSDDAYENYRLEKCYQYLEQNKEYSVVITEVKGFNNMGEEVYAEDSSHIKAWLDWYHDALCYFERIPFYYACYADNILITTSNYFLRKSVFTSVGEFRNLRYAHDWDMLLRISNQYNIHLMREPLLRYRIHEKNTIHEEGSENKVRYEVNRIIAENIQKTSNTINIASMTEAIKSNH